MSPDPIYKDIGALIKARRKVLGWKQESLANALRISRGSLANIETGKQGILVHQLYKLAAALRLKPGDLMPAVPGKKNDGERDQIPMPKGLAPELGRQIEDLILQVDTTKEPRKEPNHAKTTKRQSR